jgi:DNA-directed RNA polymerase omega subunit
VKIEQKSRVETQEEMLSLDRLVPNAGGSVFLLARIAMLRALAIDSGSPPMVDHKPLDKATTIALKEIAEGKLVSGGKPLKTELNLMKKAEDIELVVSVSISN